MQIGLPSMNTIRPIECERFSFNLLATYTCSLVWWLLLYWNYINLHWVLGIECINIIQYNYDISVMNMQWQNKEWESYKMCKSNLYHRSWKTLQLYCITISLRNTYFSSRKRYCVSYSSRATTFPQGGFLVSISAELCFIVHWLIAHITDAECFCWGV